MLRSGSCVNMRRILPPQCRNIKSSLSPGALNALGESSTKYFKPHRRQLARLSDRHQVQNYTIGQTFIRDYEMKQWLQKTDRHLTPGMEDQGGLLLSHPFPPGLQCGLPPGLDNIPLLQDRLRLSGGNKTFWHNFYSELISLKETLMNR